MRDLRPPHQGTRAPRTRTARRRRHHGWIALGTGVVFALTWAMHGPGEFRVSVSIASAYASLLLVTGSLVLGPLNVLRSRPNPVSSDLRRDLGIWGALVALLHVGAGLTVHMRGRMYLYFLSPAEWDSRLPVRFDAFGIANHLGLLSTLILLLLLALSSDRSLRALGPVRWKGWQRWNYLCVGALVLHGALYQFIEGRRLPLLVIFVLCVGLTTLLQALGWRRVRHTVRQR